MLTSSARLLGATGIGLVLGAGLAAPTLANFVAFETGHVRPLALSPDGSRLFALNTPGGRLEIFAVSGGGLVHEASLPVGLEPIAVAARSDAEVWVVNHLSDSISIVDVGADPPRVVRTLLVGDEPRDLVFAGPVAGGGFRRAFVTTARRGQNLPASLTPDLTISGTPRALVWVFDATDLGESLGGTPETILELFGDTPRALAPTPDGSTVYAAVFHSGNQTTSVAEGVVCDGGAAAAPCNLADLRTLPGGLPGGYVPGGLPAPNRNVEDVLGPETGLIVKRNPVSGLWEDSLGRNWTNAVRFDLPDLDVFRIDALANPPVETQAFAGVGTVLFDMLVNPLTGKLYVTNTEARNEVRFEGPGLSASTVRGRLHEARITVIDGVDVLPRHLNRHIAALPLGYRTFPMPAGVKEDSLATPLGMAIASDGTLYVAAFGSSKVGRFVAAELENDSFAPDSADHIELSGGGPSGLALDETNARLYVFTRFDNAVKVIDTATGAEIAQHPLHNPEPAHVILGRPFLYDARLTSSNGEASCSSCHVFGDFDSLAWDLGNPDDVVMPTFNPLSVIGYLQPFHPLKGPMTTQTLRGMANNGPMHWRGDRSGATAAEPALALEEQLAFEAFNVAFDGLLGRDEGPLPAEEMTAFAKFVLEVALPPNPIRSLDNSLTSLQQEGRRVFLTEPGTDILSTCEGCHALDPAQGFFGSDGRTTFEMEPQEFKVAHLRNAYQKVGMFGMPAQPFINVPAAHFAHQGDQVRGFGFLHDGSVATLLDFLNATVFIIDDAARTALEQFVLAFDSDFAPVVGQQVTLSASNAVQVGPRIDLLVARAGAPSARVGDRFATECDLVAKGVVDGEERGFFFAVGLDRFQADRFAEPARSEAALRALAQTSGQEITYTCVPPGSGTRIGLDRDGDGALDRDELDAGLDPEDPLSRPSDPIEYRFAGSRLLIKATRRGLTDQGNRISLLAKDPALVVPAPGSAGDPRCNGDPVGTTRALLSFASAASGASHSTELPCHNWKLMGTEAQPKGYRYRDKKGMDGTARSVVWKSRGLLKAELSGKGAALLDFALEEQVSQGTVEAALRSGDVRVCAACAADDPSRDGSDGRKFTGKVCPAPVACTP
jgi:DNA-binding beta-propeller fold protein YncE/mono/diheme cytochrome c family protein